MENLSVICAGLGIVEEDENGNRIGYTKGEYCLDNLKDLLRFLRRDDPQSREVFKQVCKWTIVGKDLIPIFEHCQDDHNLVLNAVKVLVFLTMPVEPTSNDIPQQIEYLWASKSSITFSDTVPVIVSLLESPLENLERETFTEDDWKLVQLVLTLFRNILAVQEIPPHQKAGASASQFLSLRDKFLELLFRENVMDLILVLTQHIGGSSSYLRQDNMLLLETFHYILMGQEPELIAKAYSKGLKVDEDAENSINSLRSIMEEEAEKRKLTRLRNLGSSSQFSGTFTRLTMDGSKTLFKGNPCSASHDNLLKSHKVQHRGPLKRMVWDYERLPSTKEKIRELLHDFVNQLVSGGYNVLMRSTREDIEKEHHTIESSDVAIFFLVAQFVTSFQYQKSLLLKPESNADDAFEASLNYHADSTLFKGNICGPIAASMNESMFLLVLSKWRDAYDGLKETKNYKFVSAAGSLMKIMIRMLDLVLKASPEDSKEPQTARILLYKLFYDQTDQGMTQFLFNQIRSFDIHKQAKSDLSDLIETTHVVIRLMEKLQERGTLRVSRKSRKKRAKRVLNDKSDDIDLEEHTPLQNEVRNSVCEPAGDRTPLQNKVGSSACEEYAHSSILSEEKLTTPISDATPDETGPETYELETSNHESNLPETKNNKSNENNGDLHDETGDSSGDEQLAATDEVDFKVSTLVSALANNSIIQNLCWLLKFYKSNSTSTNHYILCMLRKICDDLELSPMLYQLSLLNIFYSILDEQKSSPCKEHENIVLFLTSLVRRMLRKMKKQPLLFVEVLFWKTRKECHLINCESLMHDLKGESEKWGSVSNDAGIYSTQGKGWAHRSIADALGDDEADFVDPNEINKQREEDPYEIKNQKVFKRSKGNNGRVKENVKPISSGGSRSKEISDSEGIIEHETEGVSKRRRSLVLNQDLEEKIKGLYDKYKDNRHCSRLIAEELDPDGKVSPVQVSNKLRRLGLRVTQQKRRLQAGGPIQLEEEGARGDGDLRKTQSEESSALRRPLHTRKRVRAFSEDQETRIKALFEQFKDHKRCSHMIANAMDADGIFTAAQISRKLKKLGLLVPKRKRSEGNMHSRDEDSVNFSAESAEDSDNEPLSSRVKRSKSKKMEREIEEVAEENTDGKLLRGNSDSQLLGGALGDGEEQSSGMEIGEFDKSSVNYTANAEAEASIVGSKKQVGAPLDDDANRLQHQQMPDDLADELSDFGDDADELSDFGDDDDDATTPVASANDAVLRRKMRVVLDLEDDD